jgi:putative flippase GtrA
VNSSRSAIRTAATGTGPVASFVRFVVFGGGTGVASSGVLVLLTAYFSISLALSNALETVVSTVVANELHSRMTFRSDRRGWRMHLQSTGTVVVSYVFTTAAVLALHASVAAPSVAAEQGVYLAASGLAGIGRFAALRLYVFARGGGKATADRGVRIATAQAGSVAGRGIDGPAVAAARTVGTAALGREAVVVAA